jgi:alcohol dehydrogenase, propanol-preferring
MRAMRLRIPNEPLRLEDVPVPVPAERQVLVKVSVCAVCRTDLHIVGGELDAPKLPLVIGHMIVGRVEAAGERAYRFETGERIGVPWLGYVDETCRFCRSGLENLCVNARFTGFHIDGGYAEYCVADERFCFPLAESYDDLHAAPLLCAGLIGYRALRAAGDAQRIGLYGFGDSAHIIAQVARYQGRRVFAFTSPGDTKKQAFARSLGAEWAGDSLATPPEPLAAALIFAPVGALVPAALKALDPGGVVVCAGIHMSDIPSFPYELLWMERQIRSVANLTRRDGEEFLQIAPKVPVRTDVHPYPLAEANRALDDLANGRFEGAAVLTVAAG